MDGLQEILGLPQLTIERAALQAQEIQLEVTRDTERAIGPRGPQESRERHPHFVRVLREVPLSGTPCDLQGSTGRVWCPRGRLPVAEPLEFVEPDRNDTKRDEAPRDALGRQKNITSVEA